MDFRINFPIKSIDFSVFFKSKSGSQLSYAVNGTLPPGLILNPSTGLLDGTPITSGFFNNIRINVTDGRENSVLSNAFSMSVFLIDTKVVTITADNNFFQLQKVINFEIKSYS